MQEIMNSLSLSKIVLLIVFMCIATWTNAQKIWQLDTIVQTEQFELKTRPFTAFTLQFTYPSTEMPEVYFNGKYNTVVLDNHVNQPSLLQSVLYIQKDSIIRMRAMKNKQIRIVFQNVPSLNIHKKTRSVFRTTCNPPPMISQDVWRAGLADPIPGPSSTEMQHCIVHHSAGGNGNTDYTSLVRNYYTQHTQINGWDDIGYNFLVAFDGTIFLGRDKQNLAVPTYKVRGAHFCGKNEGTCGICLIGNFDSIVPSDTMIKSLKEVLSWVFFEEMIEATDSSPHPTFADPRLDHIAGHMQGCVTACPGVNVFSQLDSIRAQVETKRLACQQFVSESFKQPKLPIYTLRNRILQVQNGVSYAVYNPSGKLIFKGNKENQSLRFLKSGFYILRFSDASLARIYLE